MGSRALKLVRAPDISATVLVYSYHDADKSDGRADERVARCAAGVTSLF